MDFKISVAATSLAFIKRVKSNVIEFTFKTGMDPVVFGAGDRIFSNDHVEDIPFPQGSLRDGIKSKKT